MNLEETTSQRRQGTPRLPKKAAAAALTLLGALAFAGQDSLIKDLDIKQAPMLIVQPQGMAGQAGPDVQYDFIDQATYEDAASNLAVFAQVDRENRVYRPGDAVQLSVEVNEDAYLWVYDTGTSGKVHRIFPNRHDDNNFVRAGVPVAIPGPDANYDFQVTHPRGTELLTIIATTDNKPPAGHLLQTAPANGNPFMMLAGNAKSVAKDISISLREDHKVWARAAVGIRIE